MLFHTPGCLSVLGLDKAGSTILVGIDPRFYRHPEAAEAHWDVDPKITVDRNKVAHCMQCEER